jgi:hypothetical protein
MNFRSIPADVEAAEKIDCWASSPAFFDSPWETVGLGAGLDDVR